jgi:hypothetical protein
MIQRHALRAVATTARCLQFAVSRLGAVASVLIGAGLFAIGHAICAFPETWVSVLGLMSKCKAGKLVALLRWQVE